MGRADRRRRTVLAVGMLLVCCSGAFALNPALDVSQYAHTAWKVSDGFFTGIIFAIAQTPDGYLWIGTDSGLTRFDGVRAHPVAATSGDASAQQRYQKAARRARRSSLDGDHSRACKLERRQADSLPGT